MQPKTLDVFLTEPIRPVVGSETTASSRGRRGTRGVLVSYSAGRPGYSRRTLEIGTAQWLIPRKFEPDKLVWAMKEGTKP